MAFYQMRVRLIRLKFNEENFVVYMHTCDLLLHMEDDKHEYRL